MIKILRIWLISIVLFGGFQRVTAQEDFPLGSWYIYNGFFNVSPKVELFFETQLRTWEVISNPQVFFLRPYFNYNVTENFQPGLGIEYHINWSYENIDDHKLKEEEFRITIQTLLFQKIGRVGVQHRFRYEFRFLDEKGKQRTRYRIQLGIPITKANIEKGVLFATVGNEFMINTQPELDLSQNRTYVMLGYQITRGLNLQFGYMYIAHPGIQGWNRLLFFLTQKLYFYEK
jgi:hypothetical protein